MKLLRRKRIPGVILAAFLAVQGGAGPVVLPGSIVAASSEPVAPPEFRAIKGFEDGRSVEDESKRTAYSKTFVNADGTQTTRLSVRPQHYRQGSRWLDIDNSLIADSDRPGQYRNKANSFTVRFASLAQGVSITTADGTVTMRPENAADRAPIVDTAANTVTYSDAWPGVDIRYRLLPDEVKEELVVRKLPKVMSFRFRLPGRGLALRSDGGVGLKGLLHTTGSLAGRVLNTKSPLDGKWNLLPPEVQDSRGVPITEASPRYSLQGDSLTVGLNPNWTAKLTDADLPIIIDPTLWSVGSPQSRSYKADGTVCAPCAIRVGNPNQPGQWVPWRGVAYFPYEDLYGKRIVGAQVRVWNLTSGTPNGYKLDVHHGSFGLTGQGWDFPNFWGHLGHHNGSSVSDYVINDARLKGFYDDRVVNREGGYALKFIGDETNGAYTYKEMNHFTLDLTWTSYPPAPVLTSPGHGTTLQTLTPSLSAYVPDSDSEWHNQLFELCGTFADGSGGCRSQWFGVNGTWNIPASWLRPNTSYQWRSTAHDPYGFSTASSWLNFTVNRLPGIPDPRTPPDGAMLPTPATLRAHFNDQDNPTSTMYVDFQIENVGTYRMQADGSGWAQWTAGVNGPPLPSGVHRWRVSGWDGQYASDWSPWWTFTLDGSLPQPPAALDSTSHGRGATTSNNAISMKWLAGTDDRGLQGYSWTLNTSQATPADTTVDTTAQALTTTAPSNGDWWFHVRSIDVAGNASADRVFGPISINSAAIALPRIPVTAPADRECRPVPNQYDSVGCTAPPDPQISFPVESPDGYRSLYGYNGPYYSPVVSGSTVTILTNTIRTDSVVGKWFSWGMVRNETNSPVSNVVVKAKLYDATNKLLGQVTSTVPVTPLRPHEPAPFALTSTISLTKVARVDWSVTWGTAINATRKLRLSGDETFPYGSRARIIEPYYSDPAAEPYPHILEGIVENDDTVALQNPGIVAAWLDSAGKVLWVQSAPLTDATGTPIATLDPSDIASYLVPVSDFKVGPRLDTEPTTLVLWGTAR